MNSSVLHYLFYYNPQNKISSLLLVVTIVLLSFGTACSSEKESPETQSSSSSRVLNYTGSVTFLNSDDSEISKINVAVADDDISRSEGLMDVTDLPADSGMLFIFDDEEPRSFWMASTPLSLDIIYINEDFEIVRVHQNTPPYSQESIESELPAKYVVEVNAGYALRHDITEGKRIRIEQ